MTKQTFREAAAPGRMESILVLLAYMVCVDEQIHNLELEQINSAIDEMNADDSAKELVQRVFFQDSNAIPLGVVIKSIKESDYTFVLELLTRMAWVDRVAVKKEIDFIQDIARDWQIDSEVVDAMMKEAEKLSKTMFKTRHKHQRGTIKTMKTRLNLRLKMAYEKIHAKIIRDRSEQENVQNRITFYKKELLLSEPEFDAVIKQCSRISHEDYKFAKLALSTAMDTMTEFRVDLKEELRQIENSNNNKYAITKREVFKKIESIQIELDKDTRSYIEDLQSSLQAKYRSLDYFTIVFMGKTKCGKSTLHAFMTGEGWNEIGDGRQRTTRFNRVYLWNDFRMIDTPGIGAPGGKDDEEIALSVIDEADIICFIVTNDSQQETEFKFLELLKERSKPLIILLNVKHNLRHEKRLERFLKDPSKLLNVKGDNSLAGHINRIRRYAGEHYANDYFEILPVQFLAALMSREDSYRLRSKELFEASQVDVFLQNLRYSIIENGALRRSQSILGGTAGSIYFVKSSVSNKLQVLLDTNGRLGEAKVKTLNGLKRAGRSAKTALGVGIVKSFSAAKAVVQDFAEDHWNAKQSILEKEWKAAIRRVGLEKKLESVAEQVVLDYSNQVDEILIEVDQEMQLLTRISFACKGPGEQDGNVLIKQLLKYGGGIAGLVGGDNSTSWRGASRYSTYDYWRNRKFVKSFIQIKEEKTPGGCESNI